MRSSSRAAATAIPVAPSDASYHVLDPSDFAADSAARAFAVDVLMGLSGSPRRLPSRYLYDATGSDLFDRICDLDEYYLTACETEIFTTHGAALRDAIGTEPINLIDLGAGDGRKTHLLLEQFGAPAAPIRYAPIDISETAMKSLVARTADRFMGTAIRGIVGEYFDGLRWLREQGDRRNLVLFLGSNIGNFDAAGARGFLRRLWDALSPGDLLLIGFDLKKDIDRLLAAYNDREGITHQFNLNLLRRINRELGGNFDPDGFTHFSTYHVFSGAMESYLVSRQQQSVYVEQLQQQFSFAPWEPIHTEYSYKYLQTDIEGLAAAVGFEPVAQYHDRRRWFTDCLWRVEKTTRLELAQRR